MEGEDYLQEWQTSNYYNMQCDSIHSFQNLWIIFVQIVSIQNHMYGLSVLMFLTLISGTSLATGNHTIHHVTVIPHLDYTAAHIPQMYWLMFCEWWLIRNIYMLHNKEPYIYSTG
jgi:hypothetical protein